jgi:hypothetical protein
MKVEDQGMTLQRCGLGKKAVCAEQAKTKESVQ